MNADHFHHSIKHTNTIFFISLSAALSSYVILFLISGYSSLYFAADFDILARLGLEGVVYLTPLSDAKWTFDALVTVFLSKPLASFSIGMLAILLLMFVNQKSTTGLYFLLWLAIWGFNGSIGTFIGDAIFGMGTYAVAKAMEFSFSVLLVSGVFSVYFLYLIGVIVGRLYFAYLCDAPFYGSKKRIFWVTTTILLPWIVVVLINYANRMPEFSWPEFVKNITVIILILPMFIIKVQVRQSVLLKKWKMHDWIDLPLVMGLLATTIWIVFTLTHEIG